MATYKQPVGQKRLTNIAVVRVRKHGLRFEVACYKNKVMSWRMRVEKDIDEVLQTHTIFSNVGKGTLAKSEDLIKAFGMDDEDKVCREILDKGEYQVSDKEREMVAGSVLRDVTFLVMEKTVNPDTQRPYSLGMIEKFVHDVHFSLDPGKSSKQQALELIRKLSEKFPIVRAKMELRLSVPGSGSQDMVLEQLAAWGADMSSQSTDAASSMFTCVFLLDPGKYRECDALAQSHKGRLEVLSTSVQNDSDIRFDSLHEAEAHRAHQRATSSAAAAAAAAAGEVGESVEQLRIDQTGDRVADVGSAREAPAPQSRGAPSASLGGFRCTTCSAPIGSREAYREHCKSEWHKHNMRRKAHHLVPLSAEECEFDASFDDSKNDMDEYAK